MADGFTLFMNKLMLALALETAALQKPDVDTLRPNAVPRAVRVEKMSLEDVHKNELSKEASVTNAPAR